MRGVVEAFDLFALSLGRHSHLSNILTVRSSCCHLLDSTDTGNLKCGVRREDSRPESRRALAICLRGHRYHAPAWRVFEGGARFYKPVHILVPVVL